MRGTVTLLLVFLLAFAFVGCEESSSPVEPSLPQPDPDFHIYPGNGTSGLPLSVHIEFIWDQATSTNRYNLFLDESSFPTNHIGVDMGSGVLDVSGLEAFTTYFWRVQVVDAAGEEVAMSPTYRFTTIGTDYGVTFPDSELDRVVRELISIPEGDLHTSDVNRIDAIMARDEGIVDLTGLNSLPLLGTLNVSLNPIEDLSPLADNRAILTLQIEGIPASDLTPIGDMHNLLTLNASGMANAGWDSLVALTQIRQLIADNVGAQITDPVSQMDWLLYLSLASNNLTSLDWTAGLTSLRQLGVSTNSLTDLSALAGLNSLEAVTFNENQVSDLTPLASLPNLEYVQAIANQITDLEPLTSNTELVSLVVEANSITELPAAVSNWYNSLEILNISHNPIDSATHNRILLLESLHRLEMDNIGLSSLDVVSEMDELWVLSANNNSIININALGERSGLTVIALNNNQISSITSLAYVTDPVRIELSNNQISDLSALFDNSGLAAGDSLFVDGNPLSEMSLNVHIPGMIERGVGVVF
ncbi:hypothetical protein KQI63_14170 [bacterium]|nr:hypothetical protein [bacterium]